MFIKKHVCTLFLFMAVVLAIPFALSLKISSLGSYTVTFDSQGGSAVAPEISRDDNTVAFPAVPIKCIQDTRRYFDDWYLSETYYYFDGWYTTADYSTPWDFDGIVTQDMTLYAKWTAGPRQTYAAHTYGDFTYSLINNDMEAVIDGYFGSGGDLVIPDTVPDPLHYGRQIPVVRLTWAWYAWPPANNMDKVTGVTIPDSVREINYFFTSKSSFGDYTLTDVHLGSGVKAIDNEAFFGIKTLKNINLPDGLLYIGDMSFCACTSLEQLDIPNTVTHIGSNAFDNCGFTNIVIPDSVTTLGSATFARSRLTGITLGSGLLEIPYGCFWDVPSLTGIVIPDSVGRIGMSAFGEDTSLSYMQIGNNVTTVGSGVFTDTAIKTVIFGKGISIFPVDIGDSIYFNNVHFIMMGDAPPQSGFLSAYGDNIFYCAKGATGYDAPGWENVSALFRYDPSELDWHTPALVRFDLNGAEGNAPYNEDLYKGVYVNKPADPTRDGYTFSGWYTDASCQDAWDFDNPVEGEITLYAKWLEGTINQPVSVTSDKAIARVGETTDITLTLKDGTGTALPDKQVDIEGCGISLQGVTDSNGIVSFRLTPSYEEAFRIWVDGAVYPDIVFGLENESGILQVTAANSENIPYNSIYLEIQNDKGRWERWVFSGNTIRMPAPAGDYEALVVCPGNDATDGLYVVKTMTITAGQVTNDNVDWNGTVAATLTYTYDGKPIGNGELQIAKAVPDGKESRWGRPVGYYSTLNNHTVHVTPGTYSLAAIGEDEALGKLLLTQNSLVIETDGSSGYNWNPGDTQIINFNISGTLSNDIVSRNAVIDKSYVDINSGKLRINVGEHTVNHIKGRTSSGNEEYLFEKDDDILNMTAAGEADYDLNVDPDGEATLYTDTPSVFPGNGVHLGVVLKTVSGHTLGGITGNFDNNAHITVTDPDGKLIWDSYQRFWDFWYFVDWNARPGEYTVRATGNLGSLYGNYDATAKFTVTGKPEVNVTDRNGNPLILIPARRETDVKITLTSGGQPISGTRVYLDGPAGHFEGDTNGNGEIVFTVNPNGSGNFFINFNGYGYDDLLFAAEYDQGILEVSAFGDEGTPYNNIDLEIRGEKGAWTRGNGGNTARILATFGQYEAVAACSGDDGTDGLYVVKTMTITAGQVTHENVDWTGTVAAKLTYTYDGKPINNGLIQIGMAGNEGTDDRWGKGIGRYTALNNRTVHVTPGTYNLVAMGDDQALEWLFLTQNKLAINMGGNYGYDWGQDETQILNVHFTGAMPDNVFQRVNIDKFGFGINSGLVRINLGTHEVFEVYVDGNTTEGFVAYKYQKKNDILDMTADKAENYDFCTDYSNITLHADASSVSAGGWIHLGVMLTTSSGHQLIEANGNFDNNAHITVTDPDGNQIWDGYQYFSDFRYYVDGNAKPGEYTVRATGNLGWLYGNFNVTAKFTVMGKPEVKVTDMDGNPLLIIPVGQDTTVKLTLTAGGQPINGKHVYVDGPGCHFEGDTDENGEAIMTLNAVGSDHFYISFDKYNYSDLLFALEGNQGLVEISGKDINGNPLENFYGQVSSESMLEGTAADGAVARVIATEGQAMVKLVQKGGDGKEAYYMIQDIDVTAGVANQVEITPEGTVDETLSFAYNGNLLSDGDVVLESRDTAFQDLESDLGFDNAVNGIKAHVTPGTFRASVQKIIQVDGKNVLLYLTRNSLSISEAGPREYSCEWDSSNTGKLHVNTTVPGEYNGMNLFLNDSSVYLVDTDDVILSEGDYTLGYIGIDKWNESGWWHCGYSKKPGTEDIITIDPARDAVYDIDLTQKSVSVGIDNNKDKLQPGDIVHFTLDLETNGGYILNQVDGNISSRMVSEITYPDGTQTVNDAKFNKMGWKVLESEPTGIYTLRLMSDLSPFYPAVEASTTFEVVPSRPLTLQGTMDESFAEGSEDGKIITVTLINGKFVNEINADKVNLSGLPDGVSKGAVTRANDTTLTIALTGNSTVDYDADITAAIVIGGDQVTPAQSGDLAGSVTLKAAVETAPAAPAVTFSFDGANAGKLVGIKANTMEYSLTGDNGYKTAGADDFMLSDEEIAAITAENDIKVRIKENFRTPAGILKIINILPGPAAPSVSVDDATNKVIGLTKAMEFSKDGGATWTKYVNLSSLGDMRGTFTLMVRNPATSLTMAGTAAALDFTAVNPPLAITCSIALFAEGAEDGGIITVRLVNGQFGQDIDVDGITLDGLPGGVKPGTVAWTGNRTITIQLSGNSTVDYDSDIQVNVTVGKDQVIPAQPDNLTGIVTLKAKVEPQPRAPYITFSFDGINAGKLMNSTTAMEYSLDGGIVYYPVTTADMALSAEEIKSITADNDIRIRVAKDQRIPEGLPKLIDFVAGPAAPAALVFNDITNTATGLTSSMEYSVDGGAAWIRFSGSNLPALGGNVTLMVRVAANGKTLPGDAVSKDYTENPPLSVITAFDAPVTEGSEGGSLIIVTLVNGVFAKPIDPAGISLSGLPEGISKGAVRRTGDNTITIALKGNSTADYDSDIELNVSIIRSQILPLQPVDVYAAINLPATDEMSPPAPDVSFSFDGRNAGKLVGATTAMEFSLDGGVGYISVTAANLLLTSSRIASINAEDDIWVRLKPTLRNPAGEARVIDITEGLVPDLIADDVNNKIIGTMDTTMEWSTNGTTWTRYAVTARGSNLPNLNGDVLLKVRKAATGTTMTGAAMELQFTSAIPGLN